jgi:hypothetical protein
VTGAAGQALISLLDEVAPVYPDTRRWFLQSYGQFRSPTAFDLARRILEAPLNVDGVPEILTTDWMGELSEAEDGEPVEEVPQPVLIRLATVMAKLDRLEAARDTLLGRLVGSCGLSGEDRIAGPRRELVTMVTAARARGLALDVARELVGPEGRRWVDNQLRGRSAATELESVVLDALAPLVTRVRAVSNPRVSTEALAAPAQGADCTTLPFSP